MHQHADYTIPKETRIGHVHLKVADLKRSLDFYCGLLGFELTITYGNDAAFISAGGYHHHIGLNTWFSKNSPPAPINSIGLFHTAILYPTRKDLAIIFRRLLDANYPLTGTANHGVSEALYLDDPDRNGVELYWDKPKGQWPKKPDGSLICLLNRLTSKICYKLSLHKYYFQALHSTVIFLMPVHHLMFIVAFTFNKLT